MNPGGAWPSGWAPLTGTREAPMNPTVLMCALAAGIAASGCFYLASPQPLVGAGLAPARVLLGAGSLAALLSLGAFAQLLYLLPALALWTLWHLTVLALLPHLAALVAAARTEA